MSGTIGAPPDYGMLTSLVSDSATIKTRLDQLTEQSATGYVAPTLGGLGAAGAQQVLDLRPQIAHQTQWQANIDAVTGTMSVASTALNQISSIASSFYAKLPALNTLSSATELGAIASDAQQALSEVANLIDTKDGNTYVFAGQTPATAPIPNPDQITSSSFYTSINGAVNAASGPLSSAAAANALSSTTTGIAMTSSPFDPALSSKTPSVQVGEAQYVATGVLANKNFAAVSPGAVGSSTTGSYMTDILQGLATIASLTNGQQSAPGFATFINNTSQSLNNAVSAMAVDQGAFGDLQSSLASTKTELGSVHDALTAQLSNSTDVNMAATLSSLTATQTQLQASYQVIAATKNLSLVSYL